MVLLHTDNVSWDVNAAPNTHCVQVDVRSDAVSAITNCFYYSKGISVSTGGCSGSITRAGFREGIRVTEYSGQ